MSSISHDSTLSALTRGVRGVLFDIDGTLYAQSPLRFVMAAELGRATLTSPFATYRVARILSHFRHMREGLRSMSGDDHVLERLQYDSVADRLGIEPSVVERTVVEWMFRRPLKHLRRVRRSGVVELLSCLRSRGTRIGALSDYPPHEKLMALGVAEFFSVACCTTDAPINAFKPHPRGFIYVCQYWGVPPEEVLYVGDRPETDGVGAAAAGLRCFIIGDRQSHDSANCWDFSDLERAFALAA
jgi:HAD superfamily hydrolase (TIGR01549 family)